MRQPKTLSGAKLRSARRAKKLSQIALSELSGISQSRISYFETGTHKLENSGLIVLRRLAHPLGVNVDYFFEDGEDNG